MYCAEDVAARAERALQAARAGGGGGDGAPRRRPLTIGGRLARLQQERRRHQQRDDEPEDAERQRPLLAVLAQRERLSVLRVNLHAAGEGYSLTLRSADGAETESIRLAYEEKELLRCLDNEELPAELLDLLDRHSQSVFIAGCVIAEVRDFRRGVGAGNFTSTHVLLRPTQRSLLADLGRLFADRQLTHDEQLQVEAQIALATSPPLCLDPSPAVGLVSNRLQWSRRALRCRDTQRAVAHRSAAALARKRRAAELPVPRGPMQLHQFLQQKGRIGGGAAPPAKRARAFPPIGDLPPVTAPLSSFVDVRSKAKRLEFPAEPSRDSSLHLKEDNSVEWDRGGGRVMHMKLSVYLRPADDSYHGQLYVDRDYKEGRSNGARCRFPLCCRAAADLYVKQCIEIFTEYGKKSAKLTHQVVGQPARVTLTRGARERRESQAQAAAPAAPPVVFSQSVVVPHSAMQRAVRVSTPALAAQLRAAPISVRAGPVHPQLSTAGAAPQQRKQPALQPIPVQVQPRLVGSQASPQPALVQPRPAPRPQPSPQPPRQIQPQTIQIKVSTQSSQMQQLLQSQLQHIQVAVPANAGLQALLADAPSADTTPVSGAAAAAAGTSLLEKLVSPSPSATKLLPLSFQTPNPAAAVVAASAPAAVSQQQQHAVAPAAQHQPQSRAELQNPTLTELLNAPPAAPRSAPAPRLASPQQPQHQVIQVQPQSMPHVIQPGSVTMQQPASVAMQQPASVVMQQPASVTMQQPASVAMQQPASVAMQQPASVVMQQPASVTMQQPASVVMQQGSVPIQPVSVAMQQPQSNSVTLQQSQPASAALQQPMTLQPAASGSVPLQPAASGSAPLPDSAAGGDLLTTALQLVQSGDLLAELESLEGLLNADAEPTAAGAELKLEPTLQPPPAPTPPARLAPTPPARLAPTPPARLAPTPPAPQPPARSPRQPPSRQKSEPPPNVNIMSLLSDGVNVTNLQHLQQGLQTIPGLHNVQVSIPTMGAPISINVGAPAAGSRVVLASPEPLQPSPQQQQQLMQPSPASRGSAPPTPSPGAADAARPAQLGRSGQFQLVAPVVGGSGANGRRTSAQQLQPAQVIVTSSAGGQPVLMTSSSGAQPVLMTSSAGGQPVLMTSSAGGQPVLMTSSAGAQSVLMTSSAGGQPLLMTSSTGGQPVLMTSSTGGQPVLMTSSDQQQQQLIIASQSGAAAAAAGTQQHVLLKTEPAGGQQVLLSGAAPGAAAVPAAGFSVLQLPAGRLQQLMTSPPQQQQQQQQRLQLLHRQRQLQMARNNSK